MKKCTKCGEEKELSEFYKRSDTKCGYRSRCKSCTSTNEKEYCRKNRKKITKRHKRWNNDSKEKIKISRTEYYRNNKNKEIEHNKQWIRDNPEKYNEISRRKEAKRRRELGFNPLNEKFPGSVGHHINKNDVIYIPEQLHRSIPHRQGDEESMNKINQLAQEFV